MLAIVSDVYYLYLSSRSEKQRDNVYYCIIGQISCVKTKVIDIIIAVLGSKPCPVRRCCLPSGAVGSSGGGGGPTCHGSFRDGAHGSPIVGWPSKS